MFLHNFKYTFKILMRSRMLIFWTYAFPLILGTFFYMAFSNIENNEKFEVIDIAVVDNKAFSKNEVLKGTLEVLGAAGQEQMFDIQYVSEDKAEKLLEEDVVTGYLMMDGEDPVIVVDANGINETIFKSVMDEISQTSKLVEKMAVKELSEAMMEDGQMQSAIDSTQIEEIYQKALAQVQGNGADLKNISNSNLSYTMIEFYTLIAMTCLYGGIIGMTAMNQNLADMSCNGRRAAVGPASKGKVVLGSLCAGYVVQLIGLALLFVFTVLILKVDYGDNLPLIILLALTGSFAGLSMGIAVGVLFSVSEDAKAGIMIAVSMLGCFLSGMMGITMKYIVDKNMPFVNKVNPAAMITDGFYSLYYYDTLDRYAFNIISLLIFSGVMLLLSWRSLRRLKYDSL